MRDSTSPAVDQSLVDAYYAGLKASEVYFKKASITDLERPEVDLYAAGLPAPPRFGDPGWVEWSIACDRHRDDRLAKLASERRSAIMLSLALFVFLGVACAFLVLSAILHDFVGIAFTIVLLFAVFGLQRVLTQKGQ